MSVAPISIGRGLALGEAHLAVATDLVTGQPIGDDRAEAVVELEAAGLLREGVLAPRLRELAEVVAAPSLKVSLEVLGPWGLEVDLIWLAPHLAVTATTEETRLRLAPLDPVFLVADLARRVGLRNRPRRAAADHPIQVPSGLLTDLESAMVSSSGSEPADLVRLLGDAGVDQRWHSALVEVVAHRSLSWRLASEWIDCGVAQSRELSMLDGGLAGLFRVAAVAEADDEIIELAPMSASEVLHAVRACLPTTPVPSLTGDAHDRSIGTSAQPSSP